MAKCLLSSGIRGGSPGPQEGPARRCWLGLGSLHLPGDEGAVEERKALKQMQTVQQR